MRLIRSVLLSFLPIAIGCGDASTERTDVISADTVAAADTIADTVTATDTVVAADTTTTEDTADTSVEDTTVAVDTVAVDTADTTVLEESASSEIVEDVALGPVGMSVFFASTIEFSSGLDARVSSEGTHVVGTGDSGKLEVTFAGTSIGTYPCSGTSTTIVWTQSEANVQSTATTDGQCTIVVTRFGAVGERVEGTFHGVMGHADDPIGFGIPFDQGTFSVVRGSDL